MPIFLQDLADQIHSFLRSSHPPNLTEFRQVGRQGNGDVWEDEESSYHVGRKGADDTMVTMRGAPRIGISSVWTGRARWGARSLCKAARGAH